MTVLHKHCIVFEIIDDEKIGISHIYIYYIRVMKKF